MPKIDADVGQHEPAVPLLNGDDLSYIAPSLRALAVDVKALRFDPDNARLHPQRNLEAIQESLRRYGQVKPLVVRRKNNVVVAGNGTLAAAKALGWRKVAAHFVDFDAAEAAGYGLADNRTAELATWDAEVLLRLERLLSETGESAVGWSSEEIVALRCNLDPSDGGSAAWQELWQGMPEFVQDDQTSFKSVVVHFRSEEDFMDFLDKIGQTPGDVRQKSLWHPQAELGRFADKRYAAASEGGEQ